MLETLIIVIKVMVSAPPRPFIWYQFVQAQEIYWFDAGVSFFHFEARTSRCCR